MNVSTATDAWIIDMRADSRIQSQNTEDSYRYTLGRLACDHGDPDVADVTRAMVKRTLAHWPNPATRRQRHAALTSFFDWCVYEGLTESSPARWHLDDACRCLRAGDAAGALLAVQDADALVAALQAPGVGEAA